jgi:hypothetical protein
MPSLARSQHRPARPVPVGTRTPPGGGDHPVGQSASGLASGSASALDPETTRDPNPQRSRPVAPPARSATGAPFRSFVAPGAPVPPLAVRLAPAAA